MTLREFVDVEELLILFDTALFSVQEQDPQVFGELAVYGYKVLIEVFRNLGVDTELQVFHIHILRA